MQAKLQRLGVVKGTRNLKVPPSRPHAPVVPPREVEPVSFRPSLSGRQDDDPPPLSALLPGGVIVETAVGGCFVLDKVYPLTYQHGDDTLADLLAFSAADVGAFTQDARFHDVQFRQMLFLDTETTGLAGAGTLAFMVGVAFFEQEALVVRQYFLRDHGDEAAMLTLLSDLLAEKSGLVTFNGRSFDIPLLDGRYLINRMFTDLRERPHLDLLHPARRLWRQRLGSCALGSLEQTLLGLRRTQEDVPGWLIPTLYQDYLRTGDARELLRVFYHNQIDMLSMVTLAARVMHLFAHTTPNQHPVDLYSLGKWQIDLHLPEAAEQTLQWAAAGDLPLELYHQALQQLGQLLKRQERRDEAVPLWQQIAATSFDSIDAHVELAKHYEWQQQDYETAVYWTEAALKLTKGWGAGQAALVRGELEHRLQRLQRKLKERDTNLTGDGYS
ncbi:MAG: ribonuclease H-like domain-containing protein [Anaerolineales bacterium]|nr:ribonuclease H-like domain-containing protein [Anaerolineales bacterium]